ncbi:hypothetical protein HZH66_013696 [Vespula vulgaris]|uniref:Uncharacterized protein n=1 Tax=Vespula vulgaris TaxID=7454 RepID=A0A834MSQ3_VESVU|nr:hypothetical protein HZH66_013696 [Vespula vulgaris]
MKIKGRGSYEALSRCIDKVTINSIKWYDNKAVHQTNMVKIYNRQIGEVDLVDSSITLYRIKIKEMVPLYNVSSLDLLDLTMAYRKRFLNLARKCRQTGNSKNLETLSTSKVIHNTTICFSYHHLDLRDKINLKKLQIFFFVKDLQDPPHCGEPLKAPTIKWIFRPFPLFNWGFVKGMIYL